jgi:hypothetical protein
VIPLLSKGHEGHGVIRAFIKRFSNKTKHILAGKIEIAFPQGKLKIN